MLAERRWLAEGKDILLKAILLPFESHIIHKILASYDY